MATKQKVTMVDVNIAKETPKVSNEPVEVMLINHGINDSIGQHTVYTSFGVFVFNDGKLILSPEDAKKLKAGGVIL